MALPEEGEILQDAHVVRFRLVAGTGIERLRSAKIARKGPMQKEHILQNGRNMLQANEARSSDEARGIRSALGKTRQWHTQRLRLTGSHRASLCSDAGTLRRPINVRQVADVCISAS